MENIEVYLKPITAHSHWHSSMLPCSSMAMSTLYVTALFIWARHSVFT
jgi:hypothetical protein